MGYRLDRERLQSQIAFTRKHFPYDGAEGETVNALCDAADYLLRLTGKRFPIQDGPSIPWLMIAPHESQADDNHGQSLQELARRGGLGCGEAVAVLTGLRWRQIRTITEPHAKLLELIAAYEAGVRNTE